MLSAWIIPDPYLLTFKFNSLYKFKLINEFTSVIL